MSSWKTLMHKNAIKIVWGVKSVVLLTKIQALFGEKNLGAFFGAFWLIWGASWFKHFSHPEFFTRFFVFYLKIAKNSKNLQVKTSTKMASFVREVLSAAGQLSEKEDFNGKALKLKNRVDSLKFQMREKIESRLVDLIVFIYEKLVKFGQIL